MMLPRRSRHATVNRRLRRTDDVRGMHVDSLLLAICFVAMGVLVLAWAMLPHNASGPELSREYARPERSAADRPVGVQVA